MHTHSRDQVLFVTAGKGIIATETEEKEITVGDIVHITADEKHWHGATPDSAFSHIALTATGSTTTQFWPCFRRAAACSAAYIAVPLDPPTSRPSSRINRRASQDRGKSAAKMRVLVPKAASNCWDAR